MTGSAERDRLPNGATLLRCTGWRSRLAAVTVAVPLPAALAGVASLLAEVWARSGPAAGLPAAGARCAPLATPDLVALRVEVPAARFADVAGAVAGVLTLGIPAGGCDRLRQAAAATGRPDGGLRPHARAVDLLRAALFGAEHPYGMPARCRAARVRDCSQRDVRDALAVLARIPPTVAVCGGDRAGTHRLRERLSERSYPDPAPAATRDPAPAAPRTGPVTGRVTGAHALYLLGLPGAALAAPATPALHVAWAVLGGRDGLLDRWLRRERGLTYSLAAFSREFTAAGYCACVVGCAPEAVPEVAWGVRTTLSDLATGCVGDSDLDRARLRLTVAHHEAYRSCVDAATRHCCHHLAGAAPAEASRYPDRIRAVGRRELRELARTAFTPEKAVEITLYPHDTTPLGVN